MTLNELIGQMLLVGFEGLELPDSVADWLRTGRIGGIILFQRNIQSPEQVAALTSAAHAAAPRPILIGIDQEGGEVARLREAFTEAPSAMALAAGGGVYAERVAHVLGTELRALGINWNYAPVVDIAYNADNPAVGTRSPAADAATVSKIAAAQVRGYQSAGVAACAKHFPGLGDTAVDTHVGLPTLDTPLESLLARDLVPYRAVIGEGVASIMTTHTIYNTLDADLPATLSPVIVPQVLRDRLGFRGVVTTDCMEMDAITAHHPPSRSAVLAAQAGVDLILYSHTRSRQAEAYDALLDAAKSGVLPREMIENAVARVQALKARFAVTTPPDLSLIRSQAHLDLMRDAARAGTVLVRANPAVLPLPEGASVVVIEFPSVHDSGIYEATGLTGFSQRLLQRRPDARVIYARVSDGLSSRDAALDAARAADITLVVTRSAHLYEPSLAYAQAVVEAAKKSVVIAMRNPYDAACFSRADAILCTFGGAEPQLQAAVDALLGEYQPTGTLPVAV